MGLTNEGDVICFICFYATSDQYCDTNLCAPCEITITTVHLVALVLILTKLKDFRYLHKTWKNKNQMEKNIWIKKIIIFALSILSTICKYFFNYN